MVCPPAFDSDDSYKKAWDRRCEAHYRAMVSYRYHRRRQRFYDLLDKWTKAFAVVAGASLLSEPIRQHVPAIALLISSLTLLSLVFGYGDKKQSHKELADSYAVSASKIEGTSPAELNDKLVASWEAEVSGMNAREPPQLHALTTICEREQSIANGHPDHIPRVHAFKRMFADWFSFS